MDEGTRPSGAAAEEAEQQPGPEEIRSEIKETREELGDTVEALAHKADVKAQAQERVDAARAKKDELLGKAKAAAPEGATSGLAQVQAKVQANPIPFVVGGAALAGFVAARARRS